METGRDSCSRRRPAELTPFSPSEQSQSVFRTINRNRRFNLQYLYLSFVLASRWTRRSGKQWPMPEQDQRISEVVTREQSRLRDFIRRRVADPADVEDIVQEVFYELVEANRLLMPIDHVTGWLFRVARNRIIDLFRKKKPTNFGDALFEELKEEDDALRIENL